MDTFQAVAVSVARFAHNNLQALGTSARPKPSTGLGDSWPMPSIGLYLWYRPNKALCTDKPFFGLPRNCPKLGKFCILTWLRVPIPLPTWNKTLIMCAGAQFQLLWSKYDSYFEFGNPFYLLCCYEFRQFEWELKHNLLRFLKDYKRCDCLCWIRNSEHRYIII